LISETNERKNATLKQSTPHMYIFSAMCSD